MNTSSFRAKTPFKCSSGDACLSNTGSIYGQATCDLVMDYHAKIKHEGTFSQVPNSHASEKRTCWIGTRMTTVVRRGRGGGEGKRRKMCEGDSLWVLLHSKDNYCYGPRFWSMQAVWWGLLL